MSGRFTNSGRFIYGAYKRRDRAEQVLEDMYAEGDASPGEDIKIETVKNHRGKVSFYAITLGD